MKTVLIICSFLLALSSYSQSNVYHKFPVENAVWREGSGGYQSSNCSSYQYTITGDTLYGDYVYHKLTKSGANYSEDNEGNCTSNVVSYFNKYYGAFREDTINKKVYYLQSLSTSDTLLYDFDLHLGDSLPSSYINDQELHNYISLVDSVLVGNSYRRRLGVSTSWAENYGYLIEGIGSTFGLLGYMAPPFESGSDLFCFKLDGKTVYPDTSYECKLVSVVNNPYHEQPVIRIYPNPFITSSEISISKAFNSASLNIYNLLGELLVQKHYTYRDKIKLERNGLKSGIYVIKIKIDNDIIVSKKILVSD